MDSGSTTAGKLPVKREPRPDAARLAVAATALAAVAIAMRVNNAIHYPLLHGFDEVGNWRFIELLTRSFSLPDPGSDWSTAHPPLFFAAAAALCRLLSDASVETRIVAVRLGVTVASLGLALAVAFFVRRAAPSDPWRALLAAALVLFLPAHITLSAMAHEELLAAMLTSFAVVGIAFGSSRESESQRREIALAAGIGVLAGLAWVTKLSGVLVVVVAVVTFGVEGWRRRRWRVAALKITSTVLLALVVGGWYYGRNWVRHGYLYPHALPIHAEVMKLPPGERSASDYLRVPLATWLAPRVPSPELMHSVWGSTYASTWHDAHHFFLPARNPGADRAGSVLLLLAVLPTRRFRDRRFTWAETRLARRRRAGPSPAAARDLHTGRIRAVHLAQSLLRYGQGLLPARPVSALRLLEQRGARRVAPKTVRRPRHGGASHLARGRSDRGLQLWPGVREAGAAGIATPTGARRCPPGDTAVGGLA